MLWEWQDGRTEEGRRERKEVKEEGGGKKKHGWWDEGRRGRGKGTDRERKGLR